MVEAYETLSDPQKRASYDDRLRYGSNPYGTYGYGSQQGYGSQGNYGGYGSQQGYGSYGTNGSYSQNHTSYSGSSGRRDDFDDDYEDFDGTFGSFSFHTGPGQSREDVYRYVKEMLRSATESARAQKKAAGKAILNGVVAVVAALVLARVTPYFMVGALFYGVLSVIRGISAYRHISKAINSYEDEVWKKVEEALKNSGLK